MAIPQVEINVEVKVETPKAYLVKVEDCPGGEKEEWVPKSQVSDYCEEFKNGKEIITSLFIPEWLALEKGFI